MQLNSHASFLVLSDRQARVTIWHGSKSAKHDQVIAEELGLNMVHEIPGGGGRLHLVEDRNERQGKASKSLQIMLSSLWLTEQEYFSERLMTAREKPVSNSPRTMHIILKVGDGYGLKKMAVADVDANGHVPKLSFEKVDNPLMMVVVEYGNQWDLWIGVQVTKFEIRNAQAVVKTLSSNRDVAEPASSSVLFGEKIRVIKQGCERAVFRNNFSDGWRMGHRLIKYSPVENALEQDEPLACQIGCGVPIFSEIFSIFQMIPVDSEQDEQLGPHSVSKLVDADFVVQSVSTDVFGMEQQQLRADLITRPELLIGWQIKVEPYGIAVVTAMELRGIPMYCLKFSPSSSDSWVPLKLRPFGSSLDPTSSGAGANYYTPLRRVAMPESQLVPME
jgi:hypothetical protein